MKALMLAIVTGVSTQGLAQSGDKAPDAGGQGQAQQMIQGNAAQQQAVQNKKIPRKKREKAAGEAATSDLKKQ